MINKVKNKSLLVSGLRAVIAGAGMWIMAGINAVARAVFKAARYSIRKIGLPEERGFGKAVLSATRGAYMRTLEGLSTTVYAFSSNIRKFKHHIVITNKNNDNEAGGAIIYQEVQGWKNPVVEEAFNKRSLSHCKTKETTECLSCEKGKDQKPVF